MARGAQLWRKAKLGDIIERHVERVNDISGFKHFVGVDHLDSDNLCLNRFSEVDVDEIPPTFRYAFQKGMVLVPTRRPRLRKCVIAPFDGLTGEKVLVLRAIPNGGLLSGLVPFLLSSSLVQNWNIAKEVGSVTPHFRWSDMANCEIVLPPMEKQVELEIVLTAVERTFQCMQALANAANGVAESFASTAFRGEANRQTTVHPRLGVIAQGWPVVTIGELTELSQYGLSNAPVEVGNYPILRMMNLVNGRAVENEIKYVNLSDEIYNSYRLENGDLLFNRTNSIDLVGRSGIYTLEGEHVFASYLVRLKVNNRLVSPYYLSAYLNSTLGRQQVLSFATKAVSQANVSASNLAKVLLPLPPRDIQDRIVADLEQIQTAKDLAFERAEQVDAIKKAFLRRLTSHPE